MWVITPCIRHMTTDLIQPSDKQDLLSDVRHYNLFIIPLNLYFILNI